ncbi:hypothetical protein HK097_010927 [Rhizophlyctis rosea]|uniref:Uncharacterized protein n=1 Tax=Rhizophlyctis rosea TaxID=64517 RepID=A0AAD5S700_9FUNG|nr:hypothetical protein HK097_010927 [Rhizophlyctis rosea]
MKTGYFIVLSALLAQVAAAPTTRQQRHRHRKPILLRGKDRDDIVEEDENGVDIGKDVNTLFKEWKGRWGREYNDDSEESTRWGTFYGKVQAMVQHNQEYLEGKQTWYMGLNDFTDLTDDEFASFVRRKEPHPFHHRRSRAFLERRQESSDDAPKFDKSTLTMDWQLTMDGQVTSVKDQGQCNSCVAFATVATIESLSAITGNQMVDLSPQQLIDCNPSNDNGKCASYSNYWTGYNYLSSNSIAPDPLSKYPWVGPINPNTTCKNLPPSDTVLIESYSNTGGRNATQMVEVLKTQPGNFHFNIDLLGSYAGGIFAPKNCSEGPNHAALVTGYGEEDGVPYWRIRNSWGPAFGEEGYVRIQRGVNMCGAESNGITVPRGGRIFLDSTYNNGTLGNLKSGKGLKSENLKYRAIFGTNGILSLKPQTSKTLWSSHTTQKGTGPYELELSDQGTFQIQDSKKEVIYQSVLDEPAPTARYYMTVDDSGKLIVHSEDKEVVWSKP